MAKPAFEEELEQNAKAGKPSVPPLPKKLLKKRSPKYFPRSFKYSLIFHGGFLLVGLGQGLLEYFNGRHDRETFEKNKNMSKQAIRVDLVALPDVKLSDLHSVDLTQEIATPEETALQVAPSADVMRLNDAKNLKKQGSKSAKERLKEIQEQLRLDSRRKDLIEALKNKKTQSVGRQALGGNILSEGYSTSGEVADQADVYVGRLKTHLQKKWDLPSFVNPKAYKARVLMKIQATGGVTYEFIKRSGNADFDATVEKAIKDASPFPPPPAALRRNYEEDGIEWGFPE